MVIFHSYVSLPEGNDHPNQNGWWVQLHQGILDLRSAISEAEDAGVDEDETMEARRVKNGAVAVVNFAFSQEHVHIDHIATFKEIYTVYNCIYIHINM